MRNPLPLILLALSTTAFPQSLTVTPDTATSGEYGTWTVTYNAAPPGIAEGGALRVQLPDTWHSGPRNSAIRLQATDPRDENYVSCSCSNEAVTVRAIVEAERANRLIKHGKDSLDGRNERYVFVTRCEIVKGALQPGDTLSIVYGDTTGGSRGQRGPAVSTQPEPILAAVDTQGDGTFTLLHDNPSIVAKPGAPVAMAVHLPSQAVVGEKIDVLVSIVDKEWNAVDTAAELEIDLPNNAADSVTLAMQPNRGYHRFQVTAEKNGVLRLEARAPAFGLQALSNPCIVSAEAPERAIFWGDLHSHTGYSWDGVGAGSFDYARNIAGLDFYARTDHSREPANGRTRGLSADSWQAYTAETDAYHDPPAFVTLHAYECSFGRPFGHHNVYFRGAPGALLNPETSDLPKLWAALVAGDALTIPHHTGKFPGGVDFAIHDERFRRNFEMYSGHGLSETYNPEHPLAFEHSLFTGDSASLDAPTHIQDVWIRGLVVSAIAASDDHRARPGLPQYGLAAVRATENSRHAIFQALYDRQTYATTGAKILLNFAINDAPMGTTARIADAPNIAIRAHGTDNISWVELLRWLPGDEAFTVIERWEPNTLDFETATTDPHWKTGAIYYTRLEQEKLIRKRIAMAWSSPIWTQSE